MRKWKSVRESGQRPDARTHGHVSERQEIKKEKINTKLINQPVKAKLI